MTDKEFNLSEKRQVFISKNPNNAEPTVMYFESNVKEFIKRNIGCGVDIGGLPCGS